MSCGAALSAPCEDDATDPMERAVMDDRATILCVDDEAHVLHVVSLKLRQAGFEVITAEDGEEGLATAIERLPDLIVSDYQMPFMSGLEMCREIERQPATRGVPVLLLTARGFSLPREALAGTNVVAVLTKPFSPREVVDRAQALIESERAARIEMDH